MKDKWIYELFGYTVVCPKDVQIVIEKAKGEKLDVYIDCYGGSIWAGSSIRTSLMEYSGDVEQKIVGLAASAASVVSTARRCVMATTAQYMLHNVSTSCEGDYRDMEHSAETLKKANVSMANAYAQKSGMTVEEVLDLMNQESWYTAQEALDLKLIDGIMFEENSEPLIPTVANLMKNRMAAMYSSVPVPSRATLEEMMKKMQSQEEAPVQGNEDNTLSQKMAQAKLNLLKLGGTR